MRLILLLCSICITIAVSAQAVRFKQEYQIGGQTYSNIAGGIYQLPDSGFLATTTKGQWPDSQLVLLRLNKWGGCSWSKSYKFPFAIGSSQLVRHDINDYSIFVGNAVLRIDSTGNILWAKELNPGFGYCAPTKNGGLIFEGQSGDSTVEQNISVGKMDASGNILWTTAVDSLITNGIHGIISMPLTDGSEQYVMLGTTYWEYGYYEVVTCVSENGDLLWNKLTLSCAPMGLEVSSDSCLYISGYAAYAPNTNGLSLVKMAPDGQILFSNAFNVYCYGNRIAVAGDSILLSGRMAAPSDQGKFCNICLDTAMNFIWQRKVSGGTNTYFDVSSGNTIYTNDGGYATVTSRQSVSNAPYHTTVIKGDNQGNAQCNESNFNLNVIPFTWSEINDSVVRPFSVITSPLTFSVDTSELFVVTLCTTLGTEETNIYNNLRLSPNPARNSFNVQFEYYANDVLLTVINTLGQVVYSEPQYRSGQEVDCGIIENGCYYILLNNCAVAAPLIIQH